MKHILNTLLLCVFSESLRAQHLVGIENRRLNCRWVSWQHRVQCGNGEPVLPLTTHATSITNIMTEASRNQTQTLALLATPAATSQKTQKQTPTLVLAATLATSATDVTLETAQNHTLAQALAAGKKRASRFNGPACFAERNKKDFRELQKIVKWELQESRFMSSPYLNREIAAEHSERGQRPRAVYIRNQKVASTMLFDEGMSYAGSHGEKVKLRFRRAGPSNKPCSNVFFSFVRDPIETFLSGYLQVMCYARNFMRPEDLARAGASIQSSRGGNPPMWSDATTHFRQFVEEFQKNRYMSNAATHVWPQAHKIDALPRGCSYAFIGASETIVESLSALFPRGHLPPHGHKAQDDQCKTRILETLNPGDNETRLLCEVLAVDYLCFGYALPEPCVQSRPRAGGIMQ